MQASTVTKADGRRMRVRLRSVSAQSVRQSEHRMGKSTSAMTDDRLWTAVAERDARFDGLLYYGVVTTGVYCRPSCPSRRPRRDNVRYFATPARAERAGMRPCRRCRPDDMAAPAGAAAAVAAACAHMLDDGDVTIDSVAERLGIGARSLRRRFIDVLGITPADMLAAAKITRLRAGLQRHARVSDATYEAGYGSPSRMYARVEDKLGMAPKTYAAGAAGERIDYAIAGTSVGLLGIAATARGLCFARFGVRESAILRELTDAFPCARLEEAPDNAWIRALFEMADAPAAWRDLPTDVRGTAFQAKVWRALKRIPAGQTRSYAEVAAAIGAPRAVRAVAGACAANPVALAVPCHRVVPKAGGSGGYRWGEARKRELLRAEECG